MNECTFCFEQSVTELAVLLLPLELSDQLGIKVWLLVAPHLIINLRGAVEWQKTWAT